MSAIATLAASARPKFLVLTFVCIALGWAGSAFAGLTLSLALFGWVLIGGLAAHISVNLLNEYHDFKSGLDLITVKTPFSGGSGALPKKPEFAAGVLLGAVLSLLLTVVIGCYLVYLRGVDLLVIGLLGVMLILSYTPYINRNALLCLIAPGFGFGVLMVMGTAIVLSGQVSTATAWLTVPAFFLVNNLLLLNQFPDMDADQQVGRKHLLIRYGRVVSSRVYVAFMMCAYISIGLGVLSGTLPLAAVFAMLTLVMAIPTARGVLRDANYSEQLNMFLGPNVVITISTLTILAAAVLIESGG
jgi:1,4-dihydroxy-2-naphthoate octaprenyltransferase